MTDRPIIFSAPMVRALLDGRKTMTRRLAWKPLVIAIHVEGQPTEEIRDASPWQRVQPGDRLWVREAWGTHAGPGILCCENDRPNIARAGGGHSPVTFRADAERKAWGMYGPPEWRSSRFMPRRASRLTLTVTGVKVERLQEISEADAQAEGVRQFPCTGPHRGPGAVFWSATDPENDTTAHLSRTNPVSAFRALWNHLHGPDAWDANPEVVVISFDVRKGNIDA